VAECKNGKNSDGPGGGGTCFGEREMKQFLICIFLLSNQSAYADVFKASQPADSSSLQNAIKSDRYGIGYKFSALKLDSDLNQPNYTWGRNSIETFPKGYGSFDLDKSLRKELSKDEFTGPEIIQMTSRYRGLSQNQLMLLQYSSPAAADLFKYNHTTALLKMGIRSEQYNHLQNQTEDSINQLISRSQLVCINKRLQSNPDVSLDDAFKYCQGRDVLESIAENEKKIIRYSLNLISTPREIRDDILELTGEITLKDNDYNFEAPLKRIGRVLKEESIEFMSKLSSLMDHFKEDQTLSQDEMQELSMPGLEMQDSIIRNIALMHLNEQRIALASLATNLGYVKTLSKYKRADEFLRRALENPNVDASFKAIIKDRRVFIKEEIESLDWQADLLEKYNHEMTTLINIADKERLKVKQQLGKQ
jgi:hypothetical protein